MENTSPFLFDNVDEKYFLAVKGRAVGPLTAQEVYERVQSGEVGLLHFFWREGWSDWKRVCDDREFSVLVPQKPPVAAISHIKAKLEGRKAPAAAASTAPDPEARKIYLYFNGTQYGPFSQAEVHHVLKTHKLSRSAYLWIPGWANWKRMSELDEYKEYFTPEATQTLKLREEPSVRVFKKGEKVERSKKIKKEQTKTSEKTIGARLSDDAGEDTSDKRRAPRRPLVARLFLHNDQDVIIAVCRDISVGGMQVLTDRVPGPVGTQIKLNVSPGDPGKVKGFVAEGKIVRVLEDGRGFSFRFTRITDEARKAIEAYISE